MLYYLISERGLKLGYKERCHFRCSASKGSTDVTWKTDIWIRGTHAVQKIQFQSEPVSECRLLKILKVYSSVNSTVQTISPFKWSPGLCCPLWSSLTAAEVRHRHVCFRWNLFILHCTCDDISVPRITVGFHSFLRKNRSWQTTWTSRPPWSFFSLGVLDLVYFSQMTVLHDLRQQLFVWRFLLLL